MKLLVDIGNTRIKYSQWLEGISPSQGFIHKQQYRQTFQAAWSEMETPESVWVSNVAGEHAQHEIADYCQSQWQLKVSFVQVEKQFGEIDNHYQHIEQMGIDRWLAVIGARAIFKDGHVIIIDAGTAVNIELLNNDNQYLGGAILPGINLMYQALIGNTHIKESELDSVVSTKVPVIGQSTRQCVNAGVQYGLIGAIERLVQAMQNELNDDAQLLITGGGASWLQGKLEFKVRQEPDLVLLGLARVAKCVK